MYVWWTGADSYVIFVPRMCPPLLKSCPPGMHNRTDVGESRNGK